MAIDKDSAQRVRLLAVLAADAAGYSRLMSLDDQGTVAALDAARALFRDQIATHDGRVVDMAGDSVLATFDNATAAVKAALAVQQLLDASATAPPAACQRLRFRIGVHLGDVIEKADGSVYGDGVNIAARLEGLADPGGVAVSEAIRGTVKGRIGARFVALGEQQVKNIAEPIAAFRVLPVQAQPESTGPPRGPATALAGEGQPSIAVLPFDSAGDSAEQRSFADGLSDDLIGRLAAVHGLVVIARSSAFGYRGRAVDARTVGQELGVRYVVEGTLRLAAGHLRLNVGLVDCRTHGSLWNERFDGPVEQLLVMQDEITARIMNAIRVTIDQSEVRASRQLTPQALSAWQLRVRAADHFYRWKRGDMLRAIELGRRAIEAAPDEASGHAMLATALWAAAVSGWLPSAREAIDEALVLAQTSVNLNEALPTGHLVMASVLVGLRRHDEAIGAAERGWELAPGDFNANCQMGQTLVFAGRYEEAFPYVDLACRLSPRDPMIYWAHQTRAMALFGLNRHEELIAAARRVSRQLPEWVDAHTLLAAGFMALGRLDEARLALDSAHKVDPLLTIRRVMRRQPLRDEATAARLAGLLRAAGLAEA